ncbi:MULTISPECIES: cbb3-type cytochrome c oxidase subunit 3 [Nioella]|mgnify:CR=1 FL=1|jgi:cytochrome c oxidase cbb3-type subunit 4|uniref:cbb3-type cytochrome c oxidase subunit 3 n=1 Tax=Nioella TaxID=1775424 RepID=UPI000FDA69BF|nr:MULTISPECIES: cbb3-type cytochrome c oxidase subunit 3 [Nioella]
MEDTYTIMRVFAGSWGLVFMFLVFVVVILFTLRPGSRKVHQDTANIPFRHDDKPARAPLPGAQDAHLTEARQ